MRTVFENMTEMGAAVAANNLLANHTLALVNDFLDCIACERQPEARPSRTRIKLVCGGKQLGITANATIGTVVLVIHILARKGPFRCLCCDAELIQ